MKVFTIGAIAMAAALLGGCASTLNAQQQAKVDAAERLTGADAIVQNRIAESSGSISKTLELIERIERGSSTSRVMSSNSVQSSAPLVNNNMPAKSLMSGNQGMSGMGQDLLDARLRIVWKNGSAEELLRTLAQKMGVPFKISGEKRMLTPVSVVSENESMGSILGSVGKQVDRGADIVFNKNQQPFVLEMRYK